MSAPTLTDPDRLLADARRLVEPVTGMAGRLRDLLDADGLVRGYPAPAAPGAMPGCAFVDGAVAHEQTDALAWVAATGVRLVDGHQPVTLSATAVAPVSGDIERLRSALMAARELAAATAETPAADLVFMDGGLSTPLISVAQALLVRDLDVLAAVREHYRRTGIVDLVAAYVDLVAAGKVAALPKQDTATGFTGEWARRYRGDFDHVDSHVALARLRDRPLAGSLLTPGEWLTPREATEIGRTEIKAAHPDETDPLVSALAPLYARFAATDGLHVTYMKARRLRDRVVKIEYREDEPGRWSTGERITSLIDGVTLGPRVKEPLPQHQVDAAAKKVVTGTLSMLMQVASGALDDPAATSRYRT